MVKRRIKIPEWLKCPDCGSNDIRGQGRRWKGNPCSDNPPRIKVQQYCCKSCGKIFAGDKIPNEQEG